MQVSWLNLHLFIPIKDVRKLIYSMLTEHDRLVVQEAHGIDRKNLLSETFSEYCASGGYLELLQWARKNGCPWHEHTCSIAARSGHLDVLKCACENECPWDWRDLYKHCSDTIWSPLRVEL